MASGLITAVIPTLNNRQGLETLLDELSRMDLLTVVVNNGTRIKNGELRTKNNRRITVITPKTNLGFAGAVNLGASGAKTEWLLILNDDVEGINEQLVNQLISYSVNRDWVAATPMLVKPNGKIENIGYRVLPTGKVELNFDQTKTTEQDLDGLTAACLLIKTSVFGQLKGFDERFFAYLEDVDLSLRIKQAGFSFGVVTEVKVTHRHLTTSASLGKKFKAKQDLVNWWRLALKHPKVFLKPKYLPAFLIERGRNISGYIKTIFNFYSIFKPE